GPDRYGTPDYGRDNVPAWSHVSATAPVSIYTSKNGWRSLGCPTKRSQIALAWRERRLRAGGGNNTASTPVKSLHGQRRLIASRKNCGGHHPVQAWTRS